MEGVPPRRRRAPSPEIRSSAEPVRTRARNGLAAITRALEALRPRKGDIHLMAPEEVARRSESLRDRGVRVEVIGRSREGRPLHALRVGEGPITVAAIAGAHPDEPVGSATCLHLANRLASDPHLAWLRERITLHLVPQANPDGSAKNARWFPSWDSRDVESPARVPPLRGGAPRKPSIKDYLKWVQRDLPKDDVEFGFPNARPENEAIARWFDQIGRIDHYVSLHSMFLGGGALFLVTAKDMNSAQPKLRFLLERAQAVGLPLHDKDRAGQKGFHRISAGLQTAPTAEAMKQFFQAGGAEKVAKEFLLNSMQYVERNNGCPLAFVSEIPLCYDARLSSMKPLPVLRSAEEKRLADGLEAGLDEASALAQRLSRIELSPRAAADLALLDDRIAAGRAGIAALRGDLERYGDTPATEGNMLETNLNILRRRAQYFAMALAILDNEKGENAEFLRKEIDGELDGVIASIARESNLRFPSLEAQVELQLASVLAVLVGEPSSPRNRRQSWA